MISQTAESTASQLKRGEYSDPPLQLLAQAAQHIADELALHASSVDKQEIRQAVQVLNRYRHFDHTRLIGQAWHDTRGCDPRIQKHFVQALIELGAFDAADRLLDEAIQKGNHSGDFEFVAEASDYQGLRGRIQKQKFLQTKDVNFLRAATDTYLQKYIANPIFYHGANVVALRLLEIRQGLPARSGDSIQQMATAVLEAARYARRRSAMDPWPLATASEACLALEDLEPDAGWCDQSELWLYRFLALPTTDPFAIESYYRQLREVWNGNPLGNETCADRLASIIERHVVRTQRRWSVDPRRARELATHPDELEKNFSGEKTFTVSHLRSMLALCPNIGCVVDASGVRLGTGFLMLGSTFGLKPDLVFVTNAHVVSTTVPQALRPADARIIFEIESSSAGAPRHHAIDEILFTSEPEEVGRVLDKPEKLDVTIVSLKTLPDGVRGIPRAANVPLPSPTTKAFVVGHPKAGPLQFSLNDSVLLDVCRYERLMHYRTPTEPGSSGSPVFNAKWEVVALHHAGSQKARRLNGLGEYQANEAITLQSIRQAMGVGS
jgi:V8-like Glu-specific endopeptidase